MNHGIHLLVDNHNYSSSAIINDNNDNNDNNKRKLTDKELLDVAIMHNIQKKHEAYNNKKKLKAQTKDAIAITELKKRKISCKEMVSSEIDRIYYAIMECVEELAVQGENKVIIWFPISSAAWISSGRIYHHGLGKCIWYNWATEYDKWDGYMDNLLMHYIFAHTLFDLSSRKLKHMKNRVKAHGIKIYIGYNPDFGFANMELRWSNI